MLDLTKLDAGREKVDLSSLFHFNECLELIRDRRYFTVHGPRQSMKVGLRAYLCFVDFNIRLCLSLLVVADVVFASVAAPHQHERRVQREVLVRLRWFRGRPKDFERLAVAFCKYCPQDC